jgi:hypothetical protein
VRVPMNSLTSNSVLTTRAAILFIMVCEWAFAFYCGPYVLRQTEEPKRLTYRASAALLVLAVIWLQGHLYNSVSSLRQSSDDKFLTLVYALENLVGLLLVIRAALKARKNGETL